MSRPASTLLVLVTLLFALATHAQIVKVKDLPGKTVAEKVDYAQKRACDSRTACVIWIDPELSVFAEGTLPDKCELCNWIDWRTGIKGDVSGILNVRDFGAKPDDGVDDWTAIQAAIDAASVGNAGSPPYKGVFIPQGTYHIGKPLHITRGIRFYGAGRNLTTLTGFSADQGPVLVVSPPVSLYGALPTGASLATGAGTSMYLDGTYNYLLNLRESNGVELNARTAVTVEFFFKPDQAVASGSYNIISSSGTITGPDANTALSIQHTGPNRITACINVGIGNQCINSPDNSITNGNVYHIAFSWSSSTMRLFINGVLKASAGGVTGALVQRVSEDFTIGPKVSAFGETTFDNPMTKGWVDSIRISSTARYTSDFSPPTAKLTNDGSAMLLLNFDNTFDEFTAASTLYGTSYLFFHRVTGGWGQVGGFQLSDMTIIGTGPSFNHVVESAIENVAISASHRGLQFINNCFLNKLTSVRVSAGASAQFGIQIGSASGVLTMTDISLTGGHFPLNINTSSAVINGLWIELAQGTEIGASFKGDANSTVVINHPVFSSETHPTSVKYDLADVGFGSVVLNGGVLDLYSPIAHVGIFGGGSFVHVGGNYSHSAASPSVVFQIVTPLTNLVRLIAPIQQGAVAPWSDNMAAIKID